MIQLTRQGLRCDADLAAMRSEFASLQSIRLPQLLAPDLMAKIVALTEQSTWTRTDYEAVGSELLLDDPVATRLLQFVVNNPDFLSVIRQITGCDAIARFDGRAYRMLPLQPDHAFGWHDDRVEDQGRLIGMSINLSSKPYRGGTFQLRHKDSTKLLRELSNCIAADAFAFRVSEDLEHQVTPVEGKLPKTAYAGWFMSSGFDLATDIRRCAKSDETG